MSNNYRVAVLGASDNPQRYSYKAFKMLDANGHTPLLVSPKLEEVDGVKVHESLNELSDVHTLTMYVNETISSKLKDDILKLKPKRVIFNPGSENSGLMEELKLQNIEVEQACTLVLLSTKQF